MTTEPTIEPKHYQCRHIFTDGHRCGSRALRGELFCYYHHTTRKPKNAPPYAQTFTFFDLPLIEDRSSIQSAIGIVLQRIANSTLDSKRAGLLLYGLQIASLNLPRVKDLPKEVSIEDVVEDDHHGAIAPELELSEAPREQTLDDFLMEQWNLEASAEEIIPTIQALASADGAPTNQKLKTHNSKLITHQDTPFPHATQPPKLKTHNSKLTTHREPPFPHATQPPNLKTHNSKLITHQDAPFPHATQPPKLKTHNSKLTTHQDPPFPHTTQPAGKSQPRPVRAIQFPKALVVQLSVPWIKRVCKPGSPASKARFVTFLPGPPRQQRQQSGQRARSAQQFSFTPLTDSTGATSAVNLLAAIIRPSLRPDLQYPVARPNAKRPTPRGGSFRYYAGDHLISHTLTRAVPSAQRGLTSVFGMGTGVTLAVNSPANFRTASLSRSFTTE
jgi:hypothetical protein